MASKLLGSFPIASSATVVGSRWSKKRSKSYHASSYVSKDSWYETGKIQNEYSVVRHQQHKLNNHYRGIKVASKCARNFVVNSTHGESLESAAIQDRSPKGSWVSIKNHLNILRRLTRPYTLITTAINLISVGLLTVEKLSDISPTFFIGLLKAMIVTFPISLYVIGVNDLADVEIDKINKPHLPLASGEYSFRAVVLVTVSSVFLSYALGWIVGSPPLIWAISSHFIFASAYSINLPLLRWKRSTLLTALNFIIDRAIILQLALFLHMQTHVFKRPVLFPRSLIFNMAFMSVAGIVVTLSKDIPDIEGDEKFGIRTLAVRLGQKQVLWICVFLLEMSYGVSFVIGATSSFLWSKLITVLGHGFLASILWYHAKSIDFKSKAATQSFYIFLWKLICAEYLLIPFVR